MKKQYAVALAAIMLIFSGMFLAYAVDTSWFQVTTKNFQYITEHGKRITGKMYIPANATQENPAPAVVTCSGGNNEYVMHDNVNSELARNGYVVATFNPFKHGSSDIAVAETMGAVDIVKYVASLPFVDSNNIGVEGPTLGGSYLSKAAKMQPNLVRSVICGDFIDIGGSLSGLVGDCEFHCTWILAQYDEYTINPSKVLESPLLINAFKIENTIEEGKIYDNKNNEYTKTAYITGTTNFGYHFSFQVIDKILDTFSRTMETTGISKPKIQIWPIAMLGKAVGLVGMVILLFAVLSLLLGTNTYQSIRAKKSIIVGTGGVYSKVLLWISPFCSAAAYIPLYILGKRILEPTMLFPQSDSNGLAIWAAFVAGLCLICIKLLDIKINHIHSMENMLNEPYSGIAKSFVLAASAVLCCYTCNMVIKWLFGTNLGVFCTNLSVFTPRKALAACFYFPVFLIYFFFMGLFQVRYLYFRTKYFTPLFNCILFSTAGFTGLLLLNFLSFPFTDNAMFHWGRFAFAPILYMLPFLPVYGGITQWCYQKTGKIYLGSFVNTLLFTWLFIATNAMYLV